MEGFQTKVCTRCKVEQHLYFFHFYPLKGVFESRCQYCKSIDNRKYTPRPKDDTSVRFCSECGETKSISEYHFSRVKGGYFGKCKTCHNKEAQGNKLKRKYGVDLAWKEETLKAQNNKCAICEISFNDTNFKPHIDHDASNGRARAILCPICNIMLGMHFENPETLRAAGFDRHAEYIEHYKRVHEIKLVG